MFKTYFRRVKKRFARKYKDIDPEDIFLDSTNLPGFSEHRFEGRIERPMDAVIFLSLKVILVLVVVLLAGKLWVLEIKSGKAYAKVSENNRLEHTLIFSNRGVIYDRNMLELATNATREDENSFSARIYSPIEGVSHVVGYLKYPAKDTKGIYYDESYHGRDGVEKVFDETLTGTHGTKLKETDVMGHITSESIIEPPVDGKPLVLSIDAKVTQALYKSIESLAKVSGFVGGAGVIMDVDTGEILAMTSYPEYDENVMTAGSDKDQITRMLKDPAKPFLNRAVGGLYTPGSIVKPIVALAALNEGIISPSKEIESKGFISIPNPYDPSKPSIFRDWKAHGYTNMQEALAVSSDVYFYSVGGGYGGQKGLGISMLDKYFKLFGLTEKTGIELGGELSGNIPTPEWKSKNFNGDPWRLGDTYITSIGQYGTLVTPLNAARFIAAVANGGKLLEPSILKGGVEKPVERTIDLDAKDWNVVREGMRESVTYGTSVGLNVPYVKAAGKTGTAEVGSSKKYTHSWSVGFFPYDKPKYAWAVIMDKAPSTNTIGATTVVRQAFDYMSLYTPQYFNN